jgi:hypothetical protein
MSPVASREHREHNSLPFPATSAGATYCWGRGVRGILGNGEVADQNLPVAVMVP